MEAHNSREQEEADEAESDDDDIIGGSVVNEKIIEYLPAIKKQKFSPPASAGGLLIDEEEEDENLHNLEDENPYTSSILDLIRAKTAASNSLLLKNGTSSSPASTTPSSTSTPLSHLLSSTGILQQQSSDASTSDSPPLNSLLLSSAFAAAAAASGSTTGKYSCLLCPKKFDSTKMLQQHNQSFHTDKQFVCEICGKAFRFRSNLAEHRSVHTAIKPFVCRFCGKSSRLKGNLTKHILKHHKKEQNDYIGTDDIIIKKGKKSVKDPAAIDFLEKSMIVLNGGNTSMAGGGGRAASVAESHSGSSTPMGSALNAPSVEEQQRCFLLSLGLEPGDLKAESPDSDSSSGSQARTTNDQLLEKCNAYAAMDVDLNNGGEHEDNSRQSSAITEDFLSHFTSAANAGGSRSSGIDSSNVNAAVATLANLVANNNNSIHHHRNNGIGGKMLDDSIVETVSRVASSMSTPQSITSGGGAAGANKKTQCPACGKHMRKPKDLVTHLTTIHRYSPDEIANITGSLMQAPSTTESPSVPSISTTLNTTTSSSSGGGLSSSDFGTSLLNMELKQIQKSLNELKAQRNVSHLTQAVNNLDTRMGRLEKQLEMVLNTVYTLVQLQTGPLGKSK